MGVKGKLIASMEVKCGGHLVHDFFHVNSHHLPNISSKVNHFESHEGEVGKIGSVVSWKYNEDGNEKFAKIIIEAIDSQKKSITWKVIDGNVLEFYNFFTVITSSEDQWTTFALVYEKKTEDTPEPLGLLGYFLDLTKDIEVHLLKT